MSNWYILLAVLFVLINGFFVAAEFALIKVRPTQLAELSAGGSFRARIVRRLMRRLDATLSTTQLGITLTSLALGWVGEPAFASFLLPVFSGFGTFAATIAHTVASTCAFVIITILHIVLGELSPKSLAIQKSVGTALWTAVPLYGFYLVMFPAIWLLNNIARLSMNLMRIRPASETEVTHSEEELRLIIASSEESGLISEPRREILEGVFEFSRRTARQIMVPRTDVVILSSKRSIQENLDVIRTTRHTRYPLCEGNLDQTIGLIHVKDLFLAQLQGPGKKMSDLKREVLFVPENTTVEGLLSQFLEHKTHMAVILDEYGGASGIVSMENITEELFGQIQDEFDRERPEIEPLGEGRYRVRGDYLIEDLAGRLKVDVGEPAEETIGGYVLAQLGREVAPGDRCNMGSLVIEVVEGEGYRVRWVLVSKPWKDESDEEEKVVPESK